MQNEGVTHVWFEDEVGTLYDPIRGPNPVCGPKAEQSRKRPKHLRRKPPSSDDNKG